MFDLGADISRIVLIAFIFLAIEQITQWRPQQRLRPLWRQDLLYLALNGFLIQVLTIGGLSIFVLATNPLVPPTGKAAIQALPLWIATPAAIILADLGFYGAHRLFHASPLLWRFHKIHHSIEDMDWLAGHRVHPVDQSLTKTLSLGPVLALGFSDAALAIAGAIYGWHSVLLHSNTRIDFGPLARVIASPRFHHWHHANQPEAYDKNFAGQISAWDLLFGTQYLPKTARPKVLGVDDPPPAGYGRQLLYPFASTARARRSAKNAEPENVSTPAQISANVAACAQVNASP